jgi:heterodisulfide reductase subunit C
MAQKKSRPEHVVVPDNAFAHWLKAETGENVFQCYQCLKCSTGCPMAHAMDILPNQVIRMAQLGEKEELLQSETIWLCASCYTCSIRCPNDIHIAQVIDALRVLALREGVAPSRNRPPLFHRLFLRSIREYGRVYEAKLLTQFEARAGALLKNARMGLIMLLKGRMALLPHKVSDIKGIRETFQRVRGEAKRR